MLPVLLLAPLAALFVFCAPAAAVVVTASPSLGAAGLGRGETMLVTFDAPSWGGVTASNRGQVIDAIGSVGGLRLAIGGPDDAYRAITRGAASQFDFTDFTDGRRLSGISFDWGSIDSFNHVEFRDAGNALVARFTGADVLGAGPVSLLGQTRRVLFSFAPDTQVSTMRLASTRNAFEIDNIAARAVVPEPTVWALLIIGFGLVGASLRRRRQRRRYALT